MAATEKLLERMREHYRAAHGNDRLILVVDRRPESKLAAIVVAIPANSPWFELLPAEQVTELLPDGRGS